MEIAVLIFDDFETLDVFGPVEIFGRLVELYSVKFYSINGGIINNKHGISILSDKLDNINNETEILLIPGGLGTRTEVFNDKLIEQIKLIAGKSKYILTVCTGSALLAKTGLLDNKTATSNKRAFDWVITNGPYVRWNKNARWTVDENVYTSSGVSAGMDMAFGFLSDRYGVEFARRIARKIEYIWNENKNVDHFT